MFRRFRRQVGVGGSDAAVETLGGRANRERSADMVDTPIVRADHFAFG